MTPEIPAARPLLSDNPLLLRRMVDAAPDAMLVFDTRANILVANAASGRVFEWRPAELATQNLNPLVTESSRKAFAEFLAEYFAVPSTLSLESGPRWRLRRRSGSEFDAAISLSPVRVNGRVLAIAVIRPAG